MFREIRKKKNEISIDSAKHLLCTCRRGVLAVNGDDGYPYAVPMNYLYDESKNIIYFHGSKTGHKIDSIKKCNKVCFTVFGNETTKDEDWAPYLESVVVFGRCELINNEIEAVNILKTFAAKYYPNEDLISKEIDAFGKAAQIISLKIEHMSGKKVQEK